MKVSVFRNLKNYVADRTTASIIDDIKTGVVKDEVLALRQLLQQGKTIEYDERKKCLPAFTPSGSFNKRRTREHLSEYSGNIILDVDDLPPALLHYANTLARSCPYTYACFVSPGGEGLKILVRTRATPDTHKEFFLALLNHYEKLLNVFIDESGKDIPRLCLLSFDPDAHLNEASEIFNLNNKQDGRK